MELVKYSHGLTWRSPSSDTRDPITSVDSCHNTYYNVWCHDSLWHVYDKQWMPRVVMTAPWYESCHYYHQFLTRDSDITRQSLQLITAIICHKHVISCYKLLWLSNNIRLMLQLPLVFTWHYLTVMTLTLLNSHGNSCVSLTCHKHYTEAHSQLS